MVCPKIKTRSLFLIIQSKNVSFLYLLTIYILEYVGELPAVCVCFENTSLASFCYSFVKFARSITYILRLTCNVSPYCFDILFLVGNCIFLCSSLFPFISLIYVMRSLLLFFLYYNYGVIIQFYAFSFGVNSNIQVSLGRRKRNISITQL